MPTRPSETPSVPQPDPKRRKRERGALLDALADTFGRIVKVGSYYSTLTKLAQLVPIVLGLLLVALSPSAWLSGTLRQWSVWGMVAGGAIGALAFYLASSRAWDVRRIGTWALALLVAALAALRFHLALADVAFTERYAVLRAVHDYFIGTGDLQQRLYNLLAGLLFALVLFAATLGLPALGVAMARGRREQETAAEDGTSLEAARVTITTELTRLFDALEALRLKNAGLRAENEALHAETELLRAETEVLRAGSRDAQALTISRQECSGT